MLILSPGNREASRGFMKCEAVSALTAQWNVCFCVLPCFRNMLALINDVVSNIRKEKKQKVLVLGSLNFCTKGFETKQFED